MMKKNNYFLSLCLVLSALLVPINIQANDVLISLTPQTVTVDEDGVNLYDDGGPTGKVSSDFKDGKAGKVTFLPGVSTKKVMIDFKKVEIFEGSIYGQRIYVYNGTEAKAENLIAMVRKGTTPVFHSTASDGALTVVFESDNAYNAEGFEALVSLFTPQAMSVISVDVKQYTKGTVVAGNTDEPILLLNIRTQNTEPALSAMRFSFNTNGTFKQVSAAALYQTSSSEQFTTNRKVGDVVVTADGFTIDASSPVTLNEGDNYFWLGYNVADDAENDENIDAALTSITLSDGVHLPSSANLGNPDGNRKVENIIIATEGTQVRKVNNQLTFKSEKSTYSSKHAGGNKNRIVTFKPLHAGSLVQIDFSKFDLYYSKNSYGVKAKFVVYDGSTTSGKKLWELLSDADKDKGPQEIIRSASADGSLTVLFNPNDNSYVATGFEAVVSEYTPHAMALSGVGVVQASEEKVIAGAKSQEILNINIETNGNLSPMMLNGLTLDLKNSLSNLSAVKVYRLKKEGDILPKSAVPLISIEKENLNNALNITLSTPLKLNEGDNWLRVCYDISDDAQDESSIDAALTAVNIDGNVHAVTNGDPAGERLVGSIYNLVSGNNGTIEIGSNSKLMFYDDGGKDGKESKGFTATVTFAPKEAGAMIKLRAIDWSLARTDKFEVHYGSVKKQKADAVFSRTDKLDVVLSKSVDGKITVQYTTGKYVADNGFAIEVSAVKPQPLSVVSVKAVSVAPEKLFKGQTDVPMLRVDVEVKGEKGLLPISRLQLSDAANTAVSGAKVYATALEETFSTAQLYSESNAAPYDFSGDYIAESEGTHHFWIAYDISTAALPQQNVSASLASITSGSNIINAENAITATSTLKSGKSGIINVGATAEYKTIQSAVDALKDGIDAPTEIRIEKGEYNERVFIPQIPGQSVNNTLLICSATGDYKDVKIYHNNYVKPSYSTDQAAKEHGVVTFDGADYTTLKNIEVTTTNIAYPSVVHLRNMSRNVTLEGCYIHCQPTTNFQQKINLVNMYSPNVANNNNDYFTLRNSVLEGGYYGINLSGAGFVDLPKQRGGKIISNTFRNQGTKAIYVSKETDVQIIGNKVENDNSDHYDFNAIDITAEGKVNVERNTILLSTKDYANAIYVRSITAKETAPAIIANNVVSVEAAKEVSSTLLFKDGSENTIVAYNTLRLTGTGNNRAVSILGKMNSGVSFVNNIIQNEGSGVVYYSNKADNIADVKYENNHLFAANNTLASIATGYKTLQEWVQFSKERNSIYGKVNFVSNELLQPKTEGTLRSGKHLSAVTRDITDAQRDATHPMIGAYENSEDNTSTYINRTESGVGASYVYVSGKNICISSPYAGMLVQVYAPSGVLVHSQHINTDAPIVVLRELPQGIYIVRLSSAKGIKTYNVRI